MKKSLVLGASPNEARYSNKAVKSFLRHQFPVVAVGLRNGEIDGLPILTGQPVLKDIDTICLYMGPKAQAEYIDYIISLSPHRIIFNPGTENPVLFQKAKKAGIEVVFDCTLMMISANRY